MTDPKVIEEATSGGIVPDVVRPQGRPIKSEIPTQLDALRTNGRAEYGLGVMVKRAGLGFQVYVDNRLTAACTAAELADQTARALAGFTIGDGMPPWRCPKCGTDDVCVLDSRPRVNDTYRRKECRQCGVRWSTSERIHVERVQVKP